MIPNTRAQLEIGGQTITAYYKQHIRNTIHLPPYHSYLQTRFSWDDNTIRQIDWETFSTLISRYDDSRPTLVKHLHGIAPTGKYVHRNDAHESPHCPSCTCILEHNDHLFQCPADSREKWRGETLRKLRKISGNSALQQQLCNIVIAGLQCVFRDTNESLHPARFPPEYRSLIAAQNAIGWAQLFRCRWAQAWSTIQQTTLIFDPLEDSPHALTAWVRRCGRLLLAQWWELWKLRNEERHGQTRESTQNRMKATVESHLHELYVLRPTIMPVDRNMFPYETAQAHIAASVQLEATLHWCLENRPAILASQKQARERGIVRNRNIRELLVPGGGSATLHNTDASSEDSVSSQSSSLSTESPGRVGGV